MGMAKLIGKSMYTLYAVMLIGAITVDAYRNDLPNVLFDIFVLVGALVIEDDIEPP